MRALRGFALILAGLAAALAIFTFIGLAILVFAAGLGILALVRALQRRRRPPGPRSVSDAIDVEATIVERETR